MHGRPDPVLPPSTIAARLSATVSERPDHAALVLGGEALSYQELADGAGRLAGELGLEPGQRVAVIAPNVPALVVGMYAAWVAGAVAVPLSARVRRFELERAFAGSEPVAAVCVAAHAGFELAREIEALAGATPSLRVLAVLDELGRLTGCRRWPPRATPPASPPELAALLYTSGTTGEPKGAQLPHRLADAFATGLVGLLGEFAEAPYGLVVPASHAFGLGCLLAGIMAGATALLIDAAGSLEPLARALSSHGAAVLHGSPALFGRLLRAGAPVPLRTGFVAGSLCPPEVLERLDGRGTRILNLYGMTEIGAASSCRAEDPSQTRYRTVGRALPGYELRICDGEVQVRSEYLPSGYHGRPYTSEEMTSEGWFRTGDVGRLDADGNLVIAGRAHDVVHVGGFNVFPAEVESFLLTHPAIAGVAVLGAPHPVLGEALEAFVVQAPGAALEPRDVVRFARAGISGYKVPYAVHVLDELPLLASGKPDRRALAALSERPKAVSR